MYKKDQGNIFQRKRQTGNEVYRATKEEGNKLGCGSGRRGELQKGPREPGSSAKSSCWHLEEVAHQVGCDRSGGKGLCSARSALDTGRTWGHQSWGQWGGAESRRCVVQPGGELTQKRPRLK